MAYLWNIVYLIIGILAFPFLLWQRFVRGKRRGGWSAKFWGNVELPHADPMQLMGATIWFHAVSVGEVNLLDPLLKLIATKHADWNISITVGTVTGYELAKKKYPAATVSYAPLDLSWAVRRAIARIKPSMLVLVELELWPNLIGIVRRKKIPIAIVNGRLSEKSFHGYSWIKFLTAPVLRKISLICAQNEEYARRFRQLGTYAERIYVTGSLKFDGTRSERDSPEINALRAWAHFNSDDVVMVAGSTSDPEEAILFDALQSIWTEFPKFKLVIVPRHPERFEHVAKLIAEQNQSFKQRSKSTTDSVGIAPRLILVDRIGELGLWWGTAMIGFVGGSLTQRGGQNMIEPAAFGVATSFGPNTRNFRDVVQMLLAENASVVVHDAVEIERFVRRCLTEPNFAKELGQRAKCLVQKQQGATGETLRLLKKLMPIDNTKMQ